MRGRESTMPDEVCWATLFDTESAISRLLGEENTPGDVVEFGCGYGTFTFPAARHTTGTLATFDIEPEMVDRIGRKASETGLANIRAEVRDFVADGTGLPAGSQS